LAVIFAATALAACARPLPPTSTVDDPRCPAATMPLAAVLRVGDPCADDTVEVRAVGWSASSNALAIASSAHVTVLRSDDARPIADLELPGLVGITLSELRLFRWNLVNDTLVEDAEYTDVALDNPLANIYRGVLDAAGGRDDASG